MSPVTRLVTSLGLSRHPEGGYFRETYRSPEDIQGAHLPMRFGERRAVSTAIYFLLPGDQFSALHRIKSDEVWHFYAGSTLTILVIEPSGRLQEIRLGSDLARGEVFQAVVPAGAWFGAMVDDPSSYSLVGCTVAPGFDFHDFELADRQRLCADLPNHRAIIERLTRV